MSCKPAHGVQIRGSFSQLSCKRGVSFFSTDLPEVCVLQRAYRGLPGGGDVGSLRAIRGCVGGSRWGAVRAVYWAVQWVDGPGPLCQTCLKTVWLIHPVPPQPPRHFARLLIAKWSSSSLSASLRITLSPAVYFQFQPSRCSLCPLSSSLALLFRQTLLPASPAMNALFSVKKALCTLCYPKLFVWRVEEFMEKLHCPNSKFILNYCFAAVCLRQVTVMFVQAHIVQAVKTVYDSSE